MSGAQKSNVPIYTAVGPVHVCCDEFKSTVSASPQSEQRTNSTILYMTLNFRVCLIFHLYSRISTHNNKIWQKSKEPDTLSEESSITHRRRTDGTEWRRTQREEASLKEYMCICIILLDLICFYFHCSNLGLAVLWWPYNNMCISDRSPINLSLDWLSVPPFLIYSNSNKNMHYNKKVDESEKRQWVLWC